MVSFSIWHWLIVLSIILLLFGAGKIPQLMGDVARGVKSFKKGLAEDDAQDSLGKADGRAIDPITRVPDHG
ncbi:MAG: sec-independent protein translocase protein TatA [Stygiobacter sp.]|nr:MAG: sec-independent protein translocase protein TatA [Stygiobacter sp.]